MMMYYCLAEKHPQWTVLVLDKGFIFLKTSALNTSHQTVFLKGFLQQCLINARITEKTNLEVSLNDLVSTVMLIVEPLASATGRHSLSFSRNYLLLITLAHQTAFHRIRLQECLALSESAVSVSVI